MAIKITFSSSENPQNEAHCQLNIMRISHTHKIQYMYETKHYYSDSACNLPNYRQTQTFNFKIYYTCALLTFLNSPNITKNPCINAKFKKIKNLDIYIYAQDATDVNNTASNKCTCY